MALLHEHVPDLRARAGDLDQSTPPYLARTAGLTVEQFEDEVNSAFEVTAYRIRKYIGAYAVALGRVDALVFSGGIGERSPRLRAAVLGDLQVLGVELDSEANGRGSYGEQLITAPTSRILEWEIARACTSLLTDPPRIDSRSRPGLGPRPRGAAGPLV